MCTKCTKTTGIWYTCWEQDGGDCSTVWHHFTVCEGFLFSLLCTCLFPCIVSSLNLFNIAIQAKEMCGHYIEFILNAPTSSLQPNKNSQLLTLKLRFHCIRPIRNFCYLSHSIFIWLFFLAYLNFNFKTKVFNGIISCGLSFMLLHLQSMRL